MVSHRTSQLDHCRARTGTPRSHHSLSSGIGAMLSSREVPIVANGSTSPMMQEALHFHSCATSRRSVTAAGNVRQGECGTGPLLSLP